jgi:hypothetical protein
MNALAFYRVICDEQNKLSNIDIRCLWSEVGSCIGPCGGAPGSGKQNRVRTCTNPATAANGGAATCTGGTPANYVTQNGVLTELSPVTCTPPACSVGEYISIIEIGSASAG